VINGFKAGQRVWLEVRCDTVQFDFIGEILFCLELKDNRYHIKFCGGPDLRFSEWDITHHRVIAREVPEKPQ
jgi:hypothetical protein